MQLCFSTEIRGPRLDWSRLPALPERAGLGGCFTGVSGDALLVAGGSNFPDKKIWDGGRKIWHDTVYNLVKPDGAWQRAGRLPHALAYGFSVTSAQGLVCIGGADARSHRAEVFMLGWSGRDLETRPLPSLPVPLAYAAASAVGNTIYVAGGSTEPAAASASEKFFAIGLSQKQLAWQELEPCPGKPRMRAAAAALDGAFYLAGGVALESVGGRAERRYLRDAWRYTPGTGWTRLADLPKPCSAGATPAPTVDSTLYLIGGDDGSLAGFQPMENHPGFSKTVLAYDGTHNTWNSLADAPAPNATVQTAFWRGRFIFPAGEPRPGVRSSEVWALDLSEGK